MSYSNVVVQFWSYKHDAWWNHRAMGYSHHPSDAGSWTSLESAFVECGTLEDALVNGLAAAVVWERGMSAAPHVIAAAHVRAEERNNLKAAIKHLHSK